MVHAINNYFCPNVHASSISAPYIYYKVAIQLTCSLTSSIWSTPVHSRPMTSYHVTSHMTAVMCLFIVNKRKRNSKEKKYKIKKNK